ncbi:dihydrodipicolinate reductase [Francisella philomiragia]|uniref:4-hydroxy-tetrahydrodipicolinate reductase n=1 Tax=Francisella philomiragia TaxID=28110 RepID=A0AAW3D8R5_9GAMM|nr:dihydrodipicolinate reductase C-terminal domain-containing protein [Francisella philomiragia]KFJ42289.1 dihydrodipicolinate reductase, family protein [Francisella philomiragia]MBK2254085.1 dihydrodipicolinate reductase [Francisella philomiragia]MBK2272397.1 dihydrodipicolinate reductase [Francisella philomiragia]MBK2276239.1 dihydrodipicolinate reductase [Francisella philomiragia]MBK2280186.1 dihydrodipicolinate reductase [Francisella philomiragia]
MRVAIVGNGKTGSAVSDLLSQEEVAGIYDSKNILTLETLQNIDIAIVFVNAKVLQELLPTLLESNVPVICGTTGYNWDQNFINFVNQNQKTWVVANNFSLSMVIVKNMLASLGQLKQLNEGTNYSITEKHHIHKVDSPSGTAVSWRNWLNIGDVSIESIREGDIKGQHQVKVNTPHETIELKHTAHNRNLFAEGAIWAAREVVEKGIAGFFYFDELVGERLCL